MRISDWSSDVCSSDLLLGNRHDFALGKRRGIGRQPGAQPLALRDIEHGEALEERHCLGVATLARSPLFLRLGSEAVGIDDGHATLALADAPACFLRLPRSEEHTSELQSLMRISY